MKRMSVAVIALLALGACAGGPLDGARADLRAFAVKDLKAAHASAVAHDDAVAAACWKTLAEAVTARGEIPTTEGVGAATAWQSSRNLRRRLESGILEEVNIRCAPLVLGARRTAFLLRRLIGGP